jgi:hypothetical protein
MAVNQIRLRLVDVDFNRKDLVATMIPPPQSFYKDVPVEGQDTSDCQTMTDFEKCQTRRKTMSNES